MKPTHRKLLLISLFVIGLGVRGYFLTRPGFFPDMESWRKWAIVLGDAGLFHIYEADQSINYPPLYLAVLWAVRMIGEFIGLSFGELSQPVSALLKLPAVLFDIGGAALIFFIMRHFRRSVGVAGTSALLYFLNPAVIYDSASWGQVDSIPIFFLIASWYQLLRKKPLLSVLFFVLALSTKVQMIVFLPLLFFLWRRIGIDIPKIVTWFVVSFLGIHLPFLIFGGGPRLYEIYLHSVGFVTSLSHNAWNLWWPMMKLTHIPDTDPFIILLGQAVSYRFFGLILLTTCVVSAVAYIPKIKRDIDASWLFGLTALGFFLLPTQIHERYLFPMLPFLALNVFASRAGIFLYLSISLSFIANLLYVFPLHEAIGRGVSFTTMFYRDEFGVYTAILFLFLFYFYCTELRRQMRG